MRDGPRRSGRGCDDQRTANTADQLRGPRRPLAIADLVSCSALFYGALSHGGEVTQPSCSAISACRAVRFLSDFQ